MGRGLAVALSRTAEVVLVGPPGAGRGATELNSRGAVAGRCVVERLESSDSPECDWALLALKAFDIPAAVPHCAGAGRILCLSNGIGFENELPAPERSRLEYAPLTYGFRLLDDLSVESTPGIVFLAESSPLLETLISSGLRVEEVKNLPAVRWGKWVVNSAINPLGALTGLSNNGLVPAGLGPLLKVLRGELLQAVPAELRAETANFAQSMISGLLADSSNRCSMLQDLERGRRTEIAYLTGICEKRLPGRCPAAFALYSLISALEAHQSS